MDTIRVEPYDNVHNRIICEPSLLYELADYFTFTIPNARHHPKVKAGIWDGRIRLLNTMTRLLYAGLVEDIREFCELRDYEFEMAPELAANDLSAHDAEQFIKKLAPVPAPDDFQVDAFISAMRERRIFLQSPTSSGKSLIAYLCTMYLLASQEARKILIVVPTTGLVHQLASDLESYGDKLQQENHIHKIYTGQSHDTKKPIVISTWQSIHKNTKKWFSQFGAIIGDEAHQYKAKSLIAIMTKSNAPYRIGMSGTLDDAKSDQMVIKGLFGRIKKTISTKELQDRGRIASLDIKCVVLSYTDDARRKLYKKEYKDEKSFIVENGARRAFVRNLTLSLKGNTLVLYELVKKHGRPLYEEIVEHAGDRKVFFVDGKVDGVDRDALRAEVENETNAIIVASYGTFSTGINIKNLHNLVLASPTKSAIRVPQSIGRMLRVSDTKQHATLIDIVDDLTWHKRQNHVLRHFTQRVQMYSNEQFPYKIYTVKFNEAK